MKHLLLATVFSCAFCAMPVLADTVESSASSEQQTTVSTHKKMAARLKHDAFRHTLAEAESLPAKYADFKQWLNDKTGLSYSLTASFMPQRGAPNGKGTAWQSQYYGSVNWDMFQSEKFGSLSAQAAYTLVRNWGKSGNDIGNRIGVITSINDYPSNSNTFDQLSLTYQFPEKLKWLSVTLGQFPMYNFDGTAYDSNQQINFINYALSQNGSSAYSTASLGGYVTIAPNDEWSVSAGFQDAYNVTGTAISTSHFGKKKYTSFGSISYTPTIKEWGSGEYSVMVYYQPSVPAQPNNTIGWSLNAMQNFGKLGLFARINGASDSPETIKQSYVLGGVYNNPLNRNALDQIGLAVAMNKLNKGVNGSGTRSVENVFEAYWAWGISNFLTITPDIQFYVNPGANQKVHTATVASLRATVMF